MGETVSSCLAALLVAIPVLFGAFTQNTASFWSRWLEPSVGNSYLKKLYVLLSFQDLELLFPSFWDLIWEALGYWKDLEVEYLAPTDFHGCSFPSVTLCYLSCHQF